jgi:hypothetical protein
MTGGQTQGRQSWIPKHGKPCSDRIAADTICSEGTVNHSWAHFGLEA